MARRLIRWALLVLSLLVAFSLALGLFTLAKNQGWLAPLGIASESRDSQVIQAIKRTQEVSLLSLGIQGITEEQRSAKVFGRSVPGTGEKVFLQYNFNAKLGIDGAKVKVTRASENSYVISVPDFSFIGFAEPTFKVAAEDGGILSWVTADIDKVNMVNKILNNDARQQYIDSNAEILKDQTKVFYDTLITSVDPAAVTTYEFAS